MTHRKKQSSVTHTEPFYVGASSEQDGKFLPPSFWGSWGPESHGGLQGLCRPKGDGAGGSVLTWKMTAPHGFAAPHCWELAKRNPWRGAWGGQWQFFSCLQQIPPLEVRFS